MDKLQRQMKIIEQQMAEQALLRQEIEKLTNLESTRSQKSVDKVNASNFKLNEENYKNYGSDQTNFKQTSSKDVEEIISKRTKEFQKSQAEKAAHMKYLTQQRQQIMEARSRLRENYDMFRSLPSPVGTEVLMKPTTILAHNNRRVHSPESYIHNLVTDIPDAVDRIRNLRENLHQDYVSKRKPYAGELGIESYQPWQIPDFLLVRRLVEDFVEAFILKYIPSDLAIFERDIKIKKLNRQEKNWSETSKALTESTVVKLVAEEIILEVTAKIIKDISSEELHQDVMFKRMSGNMFIKEAEIQATGNPKGRDPSDPVYDIITHFFNTLQKNRDHRKKGVWVHSQPLVQPAVPPPLPLISERLSQPLKQPRQKPTQKPDTKLDKKSNKNVSGQVSREGSF